jgi:hypothetical protein
MDTYEGDQQEPLSLHKYIYTSHNPVNNIDPSGNDLLELTVASSIGSGLQANYDSFVSSLGNSLEQTILGLKNKQTARDILADNVINTAIGLAAGVVIGKVAGVVAEAALGPEVEIIATTPAAANAASSEESSAARLVAAANPARASVGKGRGGVYGTKVHTAFEKLAKGLGFKTEQSYLNRLPVRRGTKDSIRVDALEGTVENPTAVYDLKTGSATLSDARIKQIQQNLPNGQNVPVILIKPSP